MSFISDFQSIVKLLQEAKALNDESMNKGSQAKAKLDQALSLLMGDQPALQPAPEEPIEPPEPLPTPEPSTPHPPVLVTGLPDIPFPIERDKSPIVRSFLKQEADAVGMTWQALLAVAVQETLHFKSNIFHKANNPGGIKDSDKVWGRIANDPYIADDEAHNKYARFATPWIGLRALAKFFTLPNYKDYGVLDTKDPQKQLQIIWSRGYSEHIPEWLLVTQSLVRDYLTDPPPVPLEELLGSIPVTPSPTPTENWEDDPEHLSPHFTVSYDCCHLERHPNNKLPDSLRANAKLVADVLEKIRMALSNTPFTPNSWYRSAAVNAAQSGASKDSKHLEALAVDLPRTEEMWAAIHVAKPIGGLLQIESNNSHYHVQIDPASKSPMLTRYLKGAVKESWE